MISQAAFLIACTVNYESDNILLQRFCPSLVISHAISVRQALHGNA